MIPYNKKLVPVAKALRKHMTPEEKHLWYDCLKKLPFTIKRQHNIDNYIVDFYIAEKKLVIELDGIQHATHKHQEADYRRDSVLSAWGITVLRYTNESIRQSFEAVVADILRHLELEPVNK